MKRLIALLFVLIIAVMPIVAEAQEFSPQKKLKCRPFEQRQRITGIVYFAQNALMASLANAAVPSPPALSILTVISPPAAYICPRPERICLEQV